MKNLKIKQALLSVSDKRGLTELAKYLETNGVNILSTGGTATALKKDDIKITDISDYAESPEMLDGRVKTLHPKIHAGILYRRNVKAHVAQMQTMGWPGIDLIVVNLYPFGEVIAKAQTTFQEALENIDIGGPTLLRAAAKNHPSVAVLSTPDDYPLFIEEMEKSGGQLSASFRLSLAQKVFALTSQYDQAIAQYLAKAKETTC
ncbi:MAG: hypothetical protein LBV23_07845 [Deltaproteobacteria bacterium]|nr:hypothetical protein [Deltaproteobacteria bacterium]